MKLHSLKSGQPATFVEALWQGLAPDGSLYVSDNIPVFSDSDIESMHDTNFQDVARIVLGRWLTGDIPKSDLDTIIEQSLNFPIPIVKVGDTKVIELFHGPTMAFKDVAARFLAQTMGYFARRDNREVTIVVATSGDTGGAVANAFSDVSGVRVFVLFPKDGVSEFQYQQLTHGGANLHPIKVNGSFDDCQALAKQALSDVSLHNISSANSINIGRLLPQITYYVYTRAQVGEHAAVIPTGNLGNATAALLARAMGYGPDKIVLACNSNDTLSRFASTGDFAPEQTKSTLANAMDVASPSNFTRYLHFLGSESFGNVTEVYSISDREVIQTIKEVQLEHGYMLDPHTAVAWAAAEQSKLPNKVLVATASPSKFSTEIKKTTGFEVPLPERAVGKQQTAVEIEPSYQVLHKLLK